MRASAKLASLAAILAITSGETLMASGSHQVKRNVSTRSIPLTPKQTKIRKKNKAAGKARKANRK